MTASPAPRWQYYVLLRGERLRAFWADHLGRRERNLLFDYEAVGESSQVATFSPLDLPAEQRRWLAGGPGGGNERPWSPHGCGEIRGTDASPAAARAQRLGDALDYSSYGTWWAILCRP